jgi:RNA polymerase sigma-70 factor (sigma-E family)
MDEPASGAEATFAAFVRSRRADLVRLGWSLTGDAQRGEDVAQVALDRVWRRWDQIVGNGDPWPYVVRVAVSVAATDRRRMWRRAEVSVAQAPETVATHDHDPADLRAVVSSWLVRLPRGQRQVVVLRFLMDLSVEQTAHTLNCSTGTVKTQTSRALSTLRRSLSSPTAAEWLESS